ncbi:NCS2 family permease [Deinococcus pimensis]|uniref:NCS2 family permease n=1 Tax=Deinococcus pimensis TaxID=309888 RepID=UPI000484A19B|nr:NCS2 family permease [Deinococcus pimensis]
MQNTLQQGWLERYFGIHASGSTVPREVRAGLTTFLTMSYILFVNPQILSAAIPVPNAFAQLLTSTALAAAFGSLFMGLVAKYPFAQAPGMGLNAYFAFTVVLGQKIPWQTALGAVFVSGVLFVLLSVLGVRQVIVKAIPTSLKFAVTAGIGAFLAFIGLKNAGIVVANPATFVALGQLTSAPVLIALFGIVVTSVLMARRVIGAILIGIVASTLLAIVTRAPVYAGGANGALVPFGGFTNGVVSAPVWPTSLVGSLDISGAFGLGLLAVVFTFFFVDFFDATGTLTGLASRAGYLSEDGDLPRARRTFAADGLAAMFGAFMGTSTTTAYIESASGIEEGGRTGLTAVVVGVLFLLALLLTPLAGAVPAAATAPALVLVGAMMLSSLARIDWSDASTTIPVFLTLIVMPLTYNIANGVSFGVISYCAIKALGGEARKVHPLLYVVAALLLARYVWLSE